MECCSYDIGGGCGGGWVVWVGVGGGVGGGGVARGRWGVV